MTNQTTSEPRAHSRLGASNSERWWNCPGSVREISSAGADGKSTWYARQGTAAHTLAAWCLEHDFADPDEYPEAEIVVIDKGGLVDAFNVDDDMKDAVRVYVATVRDVVLADPDSQLFIEQRLDLSSLDPELFGTADVAVWSPKSRKLTVPDYKHGAGVPVEVKGNLQFLYYAIGADIELAKRLHNQDYGVTEVEVMVVQPRAPHRDGPVRRWTVSIDEMMGYAADLVAAAERTREPNAPLVAGDWCKWCPVAAQCRALYDRTLATCVDEFDRSDGPLELADVQTMTSERLGDLMRQRSIIETWLKAVKERANAEARAGRLPTGWKLVHGRTSRKWRNEAEVVLDLELYGFDKADIYTAPKLLSPAQVEKKLGKDKAMVSGHISSAPSGVLLAPFDDKRSAVAPSAADDFATAEE